MMLTWYFDAAVLILNFSTSPTSTLIAVAKPWIDASPIPSICQLAGGIPGFEFSQAIGLVTGAAQGSPAAAAESPPRKTKTIDTAAPRTASAKRPWRRPRHGPVAPAK